MKRDCDKHIKWATKKGIKIENVFICFELNLVVALQILGGLTVVVRCILPIHYRDLQEG